MAEIIVFGGAGFIGSHLCDELLNRDNSVICVDNLCTGAMENLQEASSRPKFRFIKHDVSNPLQMDADLIFNLATPASPNQYQRMPLETMRACTLGSFNTLEIATRQDAKILLTSTSEVYGDPSVHPQPESYWGNVNPHGTRSCYSEGKRCAESIFFDYRRIFNTKIKVARLFNTYGPRMRVDDGRVISNFVTQALRSEDITIYGDGSQTRSFCYVDDVVEGLIILMGTQDDCVGPINLGSPAEIALLELAEMIIGMVGSRSRMRFLPSLDDDPRRRQPSIDLAARELGWKPTTALEDGLASTIAYFERVLTKSQAATTLSGRQILPRSG